MKISVITAAFNSVRTIEDTLRSVRAQSHPEVEHVVIDGGSTDGTLDLLRQSNVRFFSESDRGIYDALNKGLAHVTGDVVGFLHSDDVFGDAGALARVAAALGDPGVDLVYGDMVMVAQGDLERVVRRWKSRPYAPGLCARGWQPPHPTFYARRSVYQRYGGFDLSFSIAADFEMALRLLDKARLKAAYIPAVQARMRMGGKSTRNLAAFVTGNREAARACRKHGFPGGVRFVATKLFLKLPQLF